MGFYRDRILPCLIRSAMRDERFAPYRDRVVTAATGRVLEIGIGAGENLTRYGEAVTNVIGIEPSASLAASARHMAATIPLATQIIEATAEALPLDDRSIDTAVITWTLCSIPDPMAALREIQRVLAPDGTLLFAEHGLAADRRVQWWQHRLTPLWRRVAGGCHLDRDVPRLLTDAGFDVQRLDQGYMRGFRPLTFIHEGSARLRERPRH